MIVSNKKNIAHNYSDKSSILLGDKYVTPFWNRVISFKSGVIVSVDELSPILSAHAKKAISKINSFLQLDENWDSYGASKPSKIAIKQAITFVKKLDRHGYQIFFTAPGPNGEVVIELKHLDKAIEIYFYADKNADYTIFQNDDAISEGELKNNFQQLVKLFIQ